MRDLLLSGTLCAALLGPFPGTASSPRPHLNSGACLSCHAEQLVTLPEAPCVSCHAGNMVLLEGHEDPGEDAGLWLVAAAGGTGLLLLLILGLVGFRRVVPAVAVLAVAALASPGGGFRRPPPVERATRVSDGFACDLAPKLSPGGDSLLFCRRGPDTDGDGLVDLRDGLGLFLLREGWELPRRITPYGLDIQGAMAAWAPDGSAFAVPLPAVGRDPAGLALFDAEGVRKDFLPAPEGEVLSPSFAPEGARIAFVEGTGIRVWTLSDDRRSWALVPLRDGTFPRLSGWSPRGGGPLFWRGISYATLARGPDGRRILPAEVPLEEAAGGRAVRLTPPGSTPMRRFKAQPVEGGVFYLAQGPVGPPGLFYFDGISETRWSKPSDIVHGFAATGEGECWAWVAVGGGEERLTLFRGPGEAEVRGPALIPNLLALAVSGDAEVLLAGKIRGGLDRALFGKDRMKPISAGGMNFFGLSAAEGSLAAVVVDSDSDGDGKKSPWDPATLWVAWRVP